jgi:hypothetical protein
MNNRNQQGSDFEAMAGLVILVVLLMGAAYLLEVTSECLVSHLASSSSDNLRAYLDDHSAGYHLAIGAVAAGVLYGGLRAFKKFFDWVGRPGLEALGIVIGVVLAGLLGHEFLGDLCRAP